MANSNIHLKIHSSKVTHIHSFSVSRVRNIKTALLSTLKCLQFLSTIHAFPFFHGMLNYGGLLLHTKAWFLLDIVAIWQLLHLGIHNKSIASHSEIRAKLNYLCVSGCEPLTRRQVLNKVDIQDMKYDMLIIFNFNQCR